MPTPIKGKSLEPLPGKGGNTDTFEKASKLDSPIDLLWSAVDRGDVDAVKEMLKRVNVDTCISGDQSTVLHIAADKVLKALKLP